MARNLAAFAAACTGLGCNTPLPEPFPAPVKSPPVLPTLLISSACTNAEIGAFAAALESWFAAVPELRRDVDVAPPEDSPRIHCDRWPSDQDDLRDDALAMAWDAQIFVNREAMIEYEADLYVVALHELGHHFGILHLGPGTVMAPGYPDTARELTDADVAAAREAHAWGPKE